jgi:hypothetical protein
MSWSYSGDPAASALDEIRFYCQDTDEDDQLISDEEIQFIYNQWFPLYTSNVYCAALVCEIIASKFAREVSYNADGVSIGANELQDKYNALASSLRDQYKALNSAYSPVDVGGIIFDEEFDSDIKPLNFGIGVFDNFRAGQQDYSGRRTNNNLDNSQENGQGGSVT